MGALRYLAGAAIVVFSSVLAFDAKSCPSNIPLSCHNTTSVENTCCFIPSGQLLQTQFWDTDPAAGPSDSWTVHGLWPDNCDGSYPKQCDQSRAYTNISDILSAAAPDTLAYMKKYWKDYKGDDESFWEHEWGKHGTCITSLEPDCYTDYEPAEEAVDFFDRTVALFKTLPTYQWLSAAGITPDSSKTYSIETIQSVLSGKHGAAVTLGCEDGALNQVWYHFNVQGSLQEGKFVAAEPDGSKSTCPNQVTYVPKPGAASNATKIYHGPGRVFRFKA